MDSRLKSHQGPMLANLERRLFLRQALSLGALSLLSGCDLTDKLTYVFDSTFSHMYDVPGVGDANWYGFVNYLLYQATDKLAWNNRVELFNDSQGVRTGRGGELDRH